MSTWKLGNALAPPNANKIVPKAVENDSKPSTWKSVAIPRDEMTILVSMISKIEPMLVESIAEYATGQKSAGEPSHIGMAKAAATIKTHWHKVKPMKERVSAEISWLVKSKNTADAPIRVTFINTETTILRQVFDN